jgi:hypothetical protein
VEKPAIDGKVYAASVLFLRLFRGTVLLDIGVSFRLIVLGYIWLFYSYATSIEKLINYTSITESRWCSKAHFSYVLKEFRKSQHKLHERVIENRASVFLKIHKNSPHKRFSDIHLCSYSRLSETHSWLH